MRKELNDLINTGLINEDRMINDIAKIIYDHKKAEKAIDKKLIERIVDVYLENEIPVVDDVQVCLGILVEPLLGKVKHFILILILTICILKLVVNTLKSIIMLVI